MDAFPGFELDERTAIEEARHGRHNPEIHQWLRYLRNLGRYRFYSVSRSEMEKLMRASNYYLARQSLELCQRGQADKEIDLILGRAGTLLNELLTDQAVSRDDLNLRVGDQYRYLQTARRADALALIDDYLSFIPVCWSQVLLIDQELGLGRSGLADGTRIVWGEVVNAANQARVSHHLYFPREAVVRSAVAALLGRPKGVPLVLLGNMLRQWPDISLQELSNRANLLPKEVQRLLQQAGYHLD